MIAEEEVIQTADVTRANLAAELAFDPAGYFDQWLSAVEEFCQRERPDTSGVLLNGHDLDFENVVTFDDQLAETLEAPGTLVVAEHGILKGNVEVSNAVIDGVFKGNITATDNVVVENHAVVIGDIITRELTIRGGAIIEGKCSFHGPREKEVPPPVWSALKISLSKVWRTRRSH